MAHNLRVASFTDIVCPLCGEQCYDHTVGTVSNLGVRIQLRCLSHGILTLFYETKTGKIRNEFGEEIFKRAPRITKKRREYLERIKGEKKQSES